MSFDRIDDAADALFQARNARQPIARLSTTMGLRDLTDAYAVQERNVRRGIEAGRRVAGRKVGLTSLAVQKQLGVDQPDWGVLWADMGHTGGDLVDVSCFIQPKAEAEVAFVIGRRLDDPWASMTDIIAAIDHLLPAIEIVDSAIADWNITLVDTVADNASGAAYVLGMSPRRISDVDVRLCGMAMDLNGQSASIGVGAACLGSPLNAVYWLARKLAATDRPLSPGDVIMSGALGPMVPIRAGDRILAEISGFAPVSVSFSSAVDP